MKLPVSPSRTHAASRAFSLTETLIALALLSAVVAAVLVCQYYGLQLHTLIRPKLDSAAFARSTVSTMVEEVRSSEYLYVGNWVGTNFVPAGPTNAQRGNALRICFVADTNNFITYYQDAGDLTLKRIGLGASNATSVAFGVTNSVVFTFRDFSGTILTNDQNNTAVDVLLQMRQDTIWLTVPESYQVRTRVARRAVF